MALVGGFGRHGGRNIGIHWSLEAEEGEDSLFSFFDKLVHGVTVELSGVLLRSVLRILEHVVEIIHLEEEIGVRGDVGVHFLELLFLFYKK